MLGMSWREKEKSTIWSEKVVIVIQKGTLGNYWHASGQSRAGLGGVHIGNNSFLQLLAAQSQVLKYRVATKLCKIGRISFCAVLVILNTRCNVDNKL